jgi:hypothetical protein
VSAQLPVLIDDLLEINDDIAIQLTVLVQEVD